MEKNRNNYYDFTVVVRCKLNDEDISISVDSGKGRAPLYRFPDSEWICYKYCKSKQIRDYVFHRAMLRYIKLDSFSIISNVTITAFSKYKTMTTKHKMQQSGKVLESKLLKHIKTASYGDKINKYNFLALEYELFIFCVVNGYKNC